MLEPDPFDLDPTFGGITFGFGLEYMIRSLDPGFEELASPGEYQGSLIDNGSTLSPEFSFAMSAIVYSVATAQSSVGGTMAPIYKSVLGLAACLKILRRHLSYDCLPPWVKMTFPVCMKMLCSYPSELDPA